MSDKKNIAVVVKERPLIKREKEKSAVKQWRIDGDSIESLSPLIQNRYTFGDYMVYSTFFSLFT